MKVALQTSPERERQIFCNRTLNLGAIKAIGYDMDYTLIHYDVAEWEGRAYEHARERLQKEGFLVEGLRFDPLAVSRGLIIDKELGNIVKADRFGFVKTATHGLSPIPFTNLRQTYGRVVVDLRDSRWAFLNTLFSMSSGCLYGQCVELLDEGKLHKREQPMGYEELFREVEEALNLTHIEGQLKAEIIQDPERFVSQDEALVDALLDQKDAGKKLMLITNSGWHYTRSMMDWAFNPRLPEGMRWQDLFDFIFVAANKPDFFLSQPPAFEVINDDGDLHPLSSGQSLERNKVYFGGNAALLEEALGVQGADILYVGDHIFADVHVSKRTVRWRTCLVLRELEEDISALDAWAGNEAKLSALMEEKTALESRLSWIRLLMQREAKGRPLPPGFDEAALLLEQEALQVHLEDVDAQAAPLARQGGSRPHPQWGPIMRAGIDKSHIGRQIERYADIYLSRVSNFLWASPWAYFRSPKSSLPHDH